MILYYIRCPSPTQRCQLQLMTNPPVLKLLFLHVILGVSFTDIIKLHNAECGWYIQSLVLHYSCKLTRRHSQLLSTAVDVSLKPRPSCSSPFFSLLSFRTWYQERWRVTLAGDRERKQWDSAPLFQLPAGAELRMCMSRGAEGSESCALPACLSRAAENRSSPHGKNILGWSTIFSIGDQNVGLNKKMGFTQGDIDWYHIL